MQHNDDDKKYRKYTEREREKPPNKYIKCDDQNKRTTIS